MIVGIVIAIVLLLIVAVSILIRYIFGRITRMELQSDQSMFDYLEKSNLYSRKQFESLDKQEVQVTSRDGLKLKGYVLEHYPNSKRWAIIVHGYTVSLYISTQYIDMFKQKGFNVLLIDQRRHGRSEGTYTTYGFNEKYDVQQWVEWIVSTYGDDCIIGLHGQSFGGGTVLEYLAIAHPNVKFVVADCPYSDLTELISYQIKVLNKLPPSLLMSLTDRYMESKAGFRFKQVSPLRAVKNSTLPVLFIHGSEDRYVPTHMSQDLYNLKREPKRLLIIDEAVHANAYKVAPEQYRNEVLNFIDDTLGDTSTL